MDTKSKHTFPFMLGGTSTELNYFPRLILNSSQCFSWRAFCSANEVEATGMLGREVRISLDNFEVVQRLAGTIFDRLWRLIWIYQFERHIGLAWLVLGVLVFGYGGVAQDIVVEDYGRINNVLIFMNLLLHNRLHCSSPISYL